MSIDLDSVGTSGDETTVSWKADDAILYALSVGAGRDPLQELQFTTENTHRVTLRAIPTLAVVLTHRVDPARRPGFGDVDPASLVHGGQGIRWHRELPVEGSARLTTRIASIEDKGSGALISLETRATGTDGDPLFASTSRIFARGHGGFGRRGEESGPPIQPSGRPDAEFVVETRPDQALLYRLNGDRNPLHADPTFARLAGFRRPILHGLGTYGCVARTLLNELLDADPSRVRFFSGRFAHPVFPGDALTLQVWSDAGDGIRFRALSGDTVVLDRGMLQHGPPVEVSAATREATAGRRRSAAARP